MLPTTSNFKTAVRTSHQVITKAEVRSPDGALLLTLSFSAGLDKGGVKLSAGQVVVDAENNVRRSFSLDILSDPTSTLVPSNYSSILAPFGNEVWVYRGVQYSTPITLLSADVSNQEFVLVGVFRISGFDANITNDGVSISIKGEDRSNYVSRNTWQGAYQLTSGSELSVALKAMIVDRYPACQFNFTPTTFTVGTIVYGTTIGGDPWADAVHLANLCGQDLYFDSNGYCSLNPLPILANSDADFTQIQGASNFTIINSKRAMVNKDVFNQIILDVQPTDGSAPYKVIAADLEPTSPTYINGKFGIVTKNLTTSLPATTTQAVTVAMALLNQHIGAQDVYNFALICDPSMDVYDILHATIAGLSLDNNLIIDTITIPLDVSTASEIVCRTIIQRTAVTL